MRPRHNFVVNQPTALPASYSTIAGSGSKSLPQPGQHLEPRIAVGGLEAHLALERAYRDHGVAADPAVGAAGVEAERGQAPLNLLQFLERRGTLAAGKFL